MDEVVDMVTGEGFDLVVLPTATDATRDTCIVLRNGPRRTAGGSTMTDLEISLVHEHGGTPVNGHGENPRT